jgi:hypothetical protein
MEVEIDGPEYDFRRGSAKANLLDVMLGSVIRFRKDPELERGAPFVCDVDVFGYLLRGYILRQLFCEAMKSCFLFNTETLLLTDSTATTRLAKLMLKSGLFNRVAMAPAYEKLSASVIEMSSSLQAVYFCRLTGDGQKEADEVNSLRNQGLLINRAVSIVDLSLGASWVMRDVANCYPSSIFSMRGDVLPYYYDTEQISGEVMSGCDKYLYGLYGAIHGLS